MFSVRSSILAVLAYEGIFIDAHVATFRIAALYVAIHS